MTIFPSDSSNNRRLVVLLRYREWWLLALAFVVAGAPCLAIGGELQARPGTSPTLLLDLGGMDREVQPGDLFGRVGETSLFWLNEVDDSGTPDDIFDDTVRFAVWRTDGSLEGTFPLFPSDVSLFSYAGELGDPAFFVLCRPERPIRIFVEGICNRPPVLELWVTDGTRGGTRRVTGGGQGNTLAGIRSTLPVSELGLLFFTRSDKETGPELWVSDGTPSGTRLVEDFSAHGWTGIGALVEVQGEVYFGGSTPHHRSFISWLGRSDGTPAGTTIARAPARGRVRFASLVPGVDRLFVVGDRPYDPREEGAFPHRTLWVLNPNKEIFTRLGELGPRYAGSSFYAAAVPGRLFIAVYSGDFTDFWSSDGSSSVTQLKANMTGRFAGSIWTEPWDLSHGRAFISLDDSSHGTEPWITDGTPEGTERLADICRGRCPSDPYGHGLFGGFYLFSAESKKLGRELWGWQPDSDARGRVEPVADLCPGRCSSWPFIHERIGDRLILAASEKSRARRLWTWSPEGEGPQRLAGVAELDIGTVDLALWHQVEQVRLVGKRLVFWATDEQGGAALWSWELPELKNNEPSPRTWKYPLAR